MGARVPGACSLSQAIPGRGTSPIAPTVQSAPDQLPTRTGLGLGRRIRMEISFSEYTMVEKTTGAVDTLGLRRPESALRDAIFPHFTGLKRDPVHRTSVVVL